MHQRFFSGRPSGDPWSKSEVLVLGLPTAVLSTSITTCRGLCGHFGAVLQHFQPRPKTANTCRIYWDSNDAFSRTFPMPNLRVFCNIMSNMETLPAVPELTTFTFTSHDFPAETPKPPCTSRAIFHQDFSMVFKDQGLFPRDFPWITAISTSAERQSASTSHSADQTGAPARRRPSKFPARRRRCRCRTRVGDN